MAITATDIRKGMVLMYEGELQLVTEFQHRTPGNLRAFIQAKLKSLASGASKQVRFSASDRIEPAFLERKDCEYLYRDSTGYVFMDSENYEQFTLEPEFVEDTMHYIIENQTVQVTFHEGKPLSVDLPSSVILTVKTTEPGVKGDTVNNVFKPATLETGLEIKVPNYINEGEAVKVDTRTGDFIERVKT